MSEPPDLPHALSLFRCRRGAEPELLSESEYEASVFRPMALQEEVPTSPAPLVLRRAVQAMDAFVASNPPDAVVRMEAAGAAVQMRQCFLVGVVYPPFDPPAFVLSGPVGLGRAMDLLLIAAEQVADVAQGLHLALVWRELHDQLPPLWVPLGGRR